MSMATKILAAFVLRVILASIIEALIQRHMHEAVHITTGMQDTVRVPHIVSIFPHPPLAHRNQHNVVQHSGVFVFRPKLSAHLREGTGRV